MYFVVLNSKKKIYYNDKTKIAKDIIFLPKR